MVKYRREIKGVTKQENDVRLLYIITYQEKTEDINTVDNYDEKRN